MIFKKDSFILGTILGFVGPILGIVIYKYIKLSEFSFRESLHYMIYNDPGYHLFTVALSLALLVNAVLFTLYINTHKDKTAKGIFVLTCVYGLLVLCIKTFG